MIQKQEFYVLDGVTRLSLNRHKRVIINSDNLRMLKNKTDGQVLSGSSVKQQCLRVLRCTAYALASSPGGLRFKPGTQPWLEGLQSFGTPLRSIQG